MADSSLVQRVEALEVFRDEVRREFAVLRDELRTEIREGDEQPGGWCAKATRKHAG